MLRLNFMYLNFCNQPAYCSFPKPFGNLGNSFDIDIGIGIAKVLFCLSKLLIKQNIHDKVLFKYQVHLQVFLDVLATVQSSYFVENLLAPASEERKSTVDAISTVLKICKAESCSLQVFKFLIRNPIRDYFLEIFCKFQITLKFGKEFNKEFVFSRVALCVL